MIIHKRLLIMTTIKQLRHFLVLAGELHFARAAEKLGISQATLSNEIKKMEENLGFQLFDRSNKWGITLTASGKSFFQHTMDIPEVLEQARRQGVEIARGRAGELAIVIGAFTYDYFNLGCACKKMKQLYPEVKLKIYDVMRSSQVAEYVRSGQADVGIMMVRELTAQTEGMAYCKIIPLQMCLAIPAGSPLAKKENLTFTDLKNARFILPPRADIPFIRKHLDELFMTNCGQLPVIAMEVLGFQGIKQMVAAGHGIALLPHHSVKRLSKDIVMREPPFELNRELIAVKADNNRSLVVNNFMNLLNTIDWEENFPE